ncbi:HlyD family type I secretion periplasmic adaptor subunit [Paraferrimonas haliotis]|uniref:HlyD family type I secretion periplasmic adaptor subunit n=1 Tax=Paraferrimonas haliotis TaxID=2013866 RepID=UPI000BA96E08|nr:HlyD family type I secretion periplasmic adaptor subunit [Paraferrimonas haliotis]
MKEQATTAKPFSLNPLPWLLLGLFIFIFGFVGSLTWAALAPLASASVAPGKLVTEIDTQAVQHQNGGVVNNILVENGTQVEKGEVLLTLSDPVLNSQLLQLKTVEFALQAKLSRIHAQLSERSIQWNQLPDNLTLAQQNTLNGEQELLEQIRNAHKQTLTSYEQQINQVSNDIDSYQSWVVSDDNSLALLREQIKATEFLLQKGYASKVDHLELQRHESSLSGRLAEHKANILRATNKISELTANINAEKTLYRQKAQEQKHQAIQELDGVTKQIEALTVLTDRIEIKAPVTGSVINLNVHTKGGVISPGSVIMEIVPNQSRIIAQVNINPKDIESVHIGLTAKVRLLSYSFRKVPAISGELINLSADSIVDPNTGQGYYQGEVVLNSNELKRAGVQLIPGMPVQTQIVLEPRTVFDYLLSPITHSLERGMKEV